MFIFMAQPASQARILSGIQSKIMAQFERPGETRKYNAIVTNKGLKDHDESTLITALADLCKSGKLVRVDRDTYRRPIPVLSALFKA